MVLPCAMVPQIILYGIEGREGDDCYLSITTGGENDDDQLDSKKSRGTEMSSKQGQRDGERRGETGPKRSKKRNRREQGLFTANIADRVVGKSRKNRLQNPLGGSRAGGFDPELGAVETVEFEVRCQFHLQIFRRQRHKSCFRDWVVGLHQGDLGDLAQLQYFVLCQRHPCLYWDHRTT